MNPLVFPYLYRGTVPDPQTLAPLLPPRLRRGGTDVDVIGLVDSGASFSVLPLDLGAQFGVDWNSLPIPITVGGVGHGVAAKLLAVEGLIGTFPPTPLLFAWATTNSIPVLLGQTNFFFEFDVCFHRSRSQFTVAPRTP